MTIASRLSSQPWMEAPETRAVVAALTRAGGRVRFVGGCVRDALLGRPVRDIDLATPEPPERVLDRLHAAGIRAIPTGIEHGTVTAVVGRRHFEITTLRADVETFGRRARVAFTDDWTEDAARRDFTINAISADPDGTVHDPFGGIADLAARRVRFVGDPETRIREDVLRLLRFFRFHAYYGEGAPDPAALDACARLAPLLPTLSGERVAGEMLRLMRAPDPAAAIELMSAAGVLRHLAPELVNGPRLRALAALEDRLGLADAVRRLASLLPDDPAAARALAARLRLSNADRDRLVAIAASAHTIAPGIGPRELRAALRRLGPALVRDIVLLAWAETHDDRHRALLDAANAWTPVALPIKGQDAIDRGVPPGPRVGRLIAAVDRWWEANDFRPDRAACLAKLETLIAGEP